MTGYRPNAIDAFFEQVKCKDCHTPLDFIYSEKTRDMCLLCQDAEDMRKKSDNGGKK